MRFRYGAILALALAPSWLCAAPPEAPPEITAPQDKVRTVQVKVPKDKKLEWRVVGDVTNFAKVESDDPEVWKFWIVSETGGRSHIVWWFTGEKGSSVSDVNKGAVPKPTDIKPDPKVDPKVDPPKPDPQTDLPIEGQGLRVMLVFDRLALAAPGVSEDQKGVVYSTLVRDYLKEKCPKGPDGVTTEARFWPSDTDASGAPKRWQDAFARAKAKSGGKPLWVSISNGTKGFEGVPPATTQGFLDLLKQYGG